MTCVLMCFEVTENKRGAPDTRVSILGFGRFKEMQCAGKDSLIGNVHITSAGRRCHMSIELNLEMSKHVRATIQLSSD